MALWLESYAARSRGPYAPSKEQLLLPWASGLAAADGRMRSQIAVQVIDRAVAAVPDVWLNGRGADASPKPPTAI